MLEKDSEKLLHLEEDLAKRVKGQQDAIASISEAIRCSRAGLQDPNRPIGVFLFMGPTGVGKTELAKAIAENLFNQEEAMIRLDMSEYMEKQTVARLIGSPPGYVGYDEGGQLTEALRRKPYSVVLLDEIEKAHSDIFNVLLQVFDDGRITDSKGRLVNCKNALFIMTSNLASLELLQAMKEKGTKEELVKRIEPVLKSHFRPEFLNRLDDILPFTPLSKVELKGIVSVQLQKVKERLKDQKLELSWDDQVVAYLSEKGYDPDYGARPLKRLVHQQVTVPLSKKLLQQDLKNHIRLSMDKEHIIIT
jgi:ATP-dependent Clp protease ATP-binding subunit ClpB